MKSFLKAVQFLTILPVPYSSELLSKENNRSVLFFPVIGLLIGLGVSFLDRLFLLLFPETVCNVFVILSFLIISGGLHLDGLADTADGLFSCQPKDRVLEIMRDSRNGAFGIAAVTCVVLLKFAALGSLPENLRWSGILMMPLAGRASLAVIMGLFPYARSEGGLASAFQENVSWVHAVWACIFLSAAGWLAGSWSGLVAGALSVIVTVALGWYIYRKIQGYTGDTLGAVCELVEVVPIFVLIARPFVSP